MAVLLRFARSAYGGDISSCLDLMATKYGRLRIRGRCGISFLQGGGDYVECVIGQARKHSQGINYCVDLDRLDPSRLPRRFSSKQRSASYLGRA